MVLGVRCALEKQGADEVFSLDMVLPGGSNLGLQLSGSVLQAICLLLNQLREQACWGEVPQVQQVDVADTEDLANSDLLKRSSLH